MFICVGLLCETTSCFSKRKERTLAKEKWDFLNIHCFKCNQPQLDTISFHHDCLQSFWNTYLLECDVGAFGKVISQWTVIHYSDLKTNALFVSLITGDEGLAAEQQDLRIQVLAKEHLSRVCARWHRSLNVRTTLEGLSPIPLHHQALCRFSVFTLFNRPKAKLCDKEGQMCQHLPLKKFHQWHVVIIIL